LKSCPNFELTLALDFMLGVTDGADGTDLVMDAEGRDVLMDALGGLEVIACALIQVKAIA